GRQGLDGLQQASADPSAAEIGVDGDVGDVAFLGDDPHTDVTHRAPAPFGHEVVGPLIFKEFGEEGGFRPRRGEREPVEPQDVTQLLQPHRVDYDVRSLRRSQLRTASGFLMYSGARSNGSCRTPWA